MNGLGSPGDWLGLLQFVFAHWLETLLFFFLIIILLLVDDPERGYKFRALALRPLYRLFRLFPRQYLAARIGSSATVFLRRHVTKYIKSIERFRVRIKWVTSAKDPVLKKDGTVVLHIPESNDQTLSILTATRAALPFVVCKSIRHKIDQSYCHAIDLAIIRKLANEIGPNAQPVFQKHFLTPETAGDLKLQQLLLELVELDDHGIFTTIFLNELESFGFRAWESTREEDFTSSVRELLEFLLQFPRRNVGEEIRLTFNGADFKIAVILVAISRRVQREGVTPYIDRVNKNLNAGIDSIYLYAFKRNLDFLRKVRQTIINDERLVLGEIQSVQIKDGRTSFLFRREAAAIVHLVRNSLFFDQDFEAQLDANDISVGSRLQGRVVDVSSTACVIETCGVLASLPRDFCSWYTVQSCTEIINEGDIMEFVVNNIDRKKWKLEVSARLPENDPWKKTSPPDVGDHINILVVTLQGEQYVCRSTNDIEIRVPRKEISWLPWECEPDAVIGSNFECVIVEKNDEPRVLLGSVRRIQDNPWSGIHKDLTAGTKLSATVSSITDNSIQVTTKNGLEGYIIGKAVEDGEYEFRDFRQVFSIGADIDVVVERVFIDRQRIRFGLRNRPGKRN